MGLFSFLSLTHWSKLPQLPRKLFILKKHNLEVLLHHGENQDLKPQKGGTDLGMNKGEITARASNLEDKGLKRGYWKKKWKFYISHLGSTWKVAKKTQFFLNRRKNNRKMMGKRGKPKQKNYDLANEMVMMTILITE